MPGKDLLASVERLVDAATGEPSDSARRRAVNDVLRAFDGARPQDVRGAFALLRDGLQRTQGRGTQVLHLTIGALVESGAPPELAWPIVERGLRERLTRAAAFARALLKRVPDDPDEASLAEAAAAVASARPLDGAAFRELPAHCLAAVACLARSPKLRKKARKDEAVMEVAAALSDAVDEASLLAQTLLLLEDEEIVVFHVPTKQAFRAVASEIATNAELSVLIGDALARDAKSGVALQVRLPEKEVAALRGERALPRPKELRMPFDVAPFSALDGKGELPPHHHDHDDDHGHDHLAPPEASPAVLPFHGKTRVVVVDDAAHDVRVMAEPSLPGLHPRLVLRGRLPAAAVARLLADAPRGRATRKRRAPRRG